MGEVINVLNELTDGDAIIVTDVGQHQMVACRYAKFNETKSNITSGGLGTMGFALPAAIGAKFGAPIRDSCCDYWRWWFSDDDYRNWVPSCKVKSDVKIMILNNQFLGNGAPVAAIVS